MSLRCRFCPDGEFEYWGEMDPETGLHVPMCLDCRDALDAIEKQMQEVA